MAGESNGDTPTPLDLNVVGSSVQKGSDGIFRMAATEPGGGGLGGPGVTATGGVGAKTVLQRELPTLPAYLAV